MKKILFALMLLVGSMVSTHAWAQNDVMQQAMAGYQQMTSIKANVKKTVHNEMVTKDVVTTGTFYMKKPAMICISTNGGKDKLVTDGTNFTIVQNGKASTASGKGNSSLSPLVNAIQGITNGNANTDLSDVADVDMEREGNNMIMTVTPITKSAAEKKKLIYQSFVITIDQKAGELRSVRLVGKGKNWEQYDLSNYQLNVSIDDSVFSVK